MPSIPRQKMEAGPRCSSPEPMWGAIRCTGIQPMVPVQGPSSTPANPNKGKQKLRDLKHSGFDGPRTVPM